MFINNRWIVILFVALFLFSSHGKKPFSPLTNLKQSYDLEDLYQRPAVSLLTLQTISKQYLMSAADPISKLYYEPTTQWIVEDFFADKTGSKEISDTVLLYTSERRLPIKIVFSLIFVESSFSLNAINSNSNSNDYGLFQLNSNTFRHLSHEDFFHLETNVKMGTSYLAYAFNLDPDPRMALAIYNAGPARPLRGQTPASTKKYVSRILKYSKKLEDEFYRYVWHKLSLSQLDQNTSNA